VKNVQFYLRFTIHDSLFHYDRQSLINRRVRSRDNVNAYELAYTPGGCGSGVGRRLYCCDITADDGRHKTGTDLLVSDKLNVRGLDHCIGCLDHGNETFALDHS
jgi:hypothetical protein